MICLRLVDPHDLSVVASRMRAIERVECRAAGHDELTALKLAVAGSRHVRTACEGENGEALCIFGLMPISLMDGTAAPWMLGTDAVADYPVPMLRTGRRVLRSWQALFPHLAGNVHRDNLPSIRWLEKLGFAVEAELVDIGGEPHRRFWKD